MNTLQNEKKTTRRFCILIQRRNKTVHAQAKILFSIPFQLVATLIIGFQRIALLLFVTITYTYKQSVLIFWLLPRKTDKDSIKLQSPLNFRFFSNNLYRVHCTYMAFWIVIEIVFFFRWNCKKIRISGRDIFLLLLHF